MVMNSKSGIIDSYVGNECHILKIFNFLSIN